MTHSAAPTATLRLSPEDSGPPGVVLPQPAALLGESLRELHRRDAILGAVSFAATRFLRADGWAEGMSEVLARLGAATAVSRVYIFQVVHDRGGEALATLLYEWAAAGVSAQIGNPELHPLPLRAAGFGRWEEVLGGGGVLQGQVQDFPRAERQHLEAQGIRSVLAVPVAADGRWWGFVGFDDCLGERTWSAAEVEALRIAAELVGSAIAREAREARLRRADRLEGISRLAGGIAHDFNNNLTVIGGFASLLQQELQAPEPLAYVQEIRSAVQRAAGLTQQLLAYSRRQVLQPVELDLGALVGDGEEELRRQLPPAVELRLLLAPQSGRVRMDAERMRQVLRNLVANAAEAMPAGGTLTLRTCDTRFAAADPARPAFLPPGDYVCLRVEDTGAGMTPEVAMQAFEPFFTTKERGTGLGLSTVYGIVRQSGGYVWLDSRVGEGSRVFVCLPRLRPAGEVGDAGRTEPLPAGTATVLLAEDEPAVRALALTLLRRGGYRVLEATDGEEALALAAQHAGPIHLLLTDVTMPRMGGQELSQRLLQQRPAAKVLFMSGYTAGMLGGEAGLPAGTVFLQKPFSPERFLRRVRELLEGEPTAP